MRRKITIDNSRSNDLNKKIAIIKNLGSNEIKRTPASAFLNINDAVSNTLGRRQAVFFEVDVDLNQKVENVLPKKPFRDIIQPLELEENQNDITVTTKFLEPIPTPTPPPVPTPTPTPLPYICVFGAGTTIVNPWI